ncbi:MAG: glutamyl-tRNA reductase [Saprospiraceae bacterium]|nr:glutamyl-tRNA reductase [Saprospiraceae bacterium]
MLRHFHLFTVDFNETPITDLSQYFAQEEDLPALQNEFDLKGLFYNATCNRVLYCFYIKTQLPEDFVMNFFQRINPQLNREKIRIQVKTKNGIKAVEHIFRVCSSLESLVVGEREILGQMKKSFENARQHGLIDDNLRLLCERAIVCGKEVFSNTKIAEKPVSVVSLAFRKFIEKVANKDAQVFLIGAGETNILMAKYLSKAGYQNVSVFNRTVEKASILAEKYSWEHAPLEDLPQQEVIPEALLLCTGSPEPIVTEVVLDSIRGENEPLIIDLSVPGGVETGAIKSEQQLVTIEDLKQLAKENLSFRRSEISLSEIIVEKALKNFLAIYKERAIEVALKDIPTEIKNVKENALENVFRDRFAAKDADTQRLVREMMDYMEKKCIAIPMKATKEALLN